MSTHNISFSTYKRKSPCIIPNLQLWYSFQGAQERVRNSRGKGATEGLLYTVCVMVISCLKLQASYIYCEILRVTVWDFDRNKMKFGKIADF